MKADFFIEVMLVEDIRKLLENLGIKVDKDRVYVDLRQLLENFPNPPRLAPILNKRIDRTFHPHGEKDLQNPTVVFLDSLAHFVVEQADSAVQSFAKTVRYNLSRFVGHYSDKSEEKGMSSQGKK